MTVDTVTGYTFDAGYTFGAHCMHTTALHNTIITENPD